ncbi:NAD(P)-binding protein [Nocardioides sp. zg-536]|uniref:NAD(P)-binding protein n=1 Tax=Nocardioides faecalis TaxID=2803858 RepID=A0A938Y976_9ACTN|nr:NAD(P)-binding protein [Nocardioides faecalis]MBM9461630.1 NAD(P)-binding protein [Nocardioides faecalis]QVI57410.1 NAD(P)-binding protein [Nocardioides faecalis]
MNTLLAQPLRIGSFTAPNRIMQAAHSKQYSDRVESERETAYYVRRAEGGCGLFVAGNHFVHPSGSIRGFEDAWRPESVAANTAMTSAIHDAGARVLVQLNHHGAQAAPQGPAGPRPVYAPSRMISPSTGVATRELSHGDIRELVAAWARSAELAREGGFDGVEIHLAHGYLGHQFLSPLYNARTDSYGGDLEGRTRFPREVLAAVRAAVGDDYTVGIRICLNEHHEGEPGRGLSAADLREVVARLRAETRIDFIDTAAGGYHDVHWVFPSSAMPVAWLREDVAALKQANPDIPVFGVGSAWAVEEAEEVLASGIADMVALTRGQLADPDLAHKLLTGRTETVRHCIRLNQGCLGRGSVGLPVTCTVNPDAGRELDRLPEPGPAQRWTVVGGGPAGMHAAIRLAQDGHPVTLLEAAPVLGGQLRRAVRVPGRGSVGLLLSDLERDVARAGVDVRLGVAADVAAIAATAPQRVLLATGAVAPTGDTHTTLAFGSGFAEPAPASIDAWTAMDAAQAASGPKLGPRVLVVDDDGTAYASGVLLSLVGAGLDVHVATPYETLLPHVGTGYERQVVLRTLAAGSFTRTVGVRVRSTPDGLRLVDQLTGEEREVGQVDTVVALTPRQAVRVAGLDAEELSDALGVPVTAVGDALSPRNLDAAIHEAHWVATGRTLPSRES